MSPSGPALEEVWRRETPHVLGALVRRYGDFDAAEDALQEALLAAATQWPRDGVPGSPRGWLVRVASRRLVDDVRSEVARRGREERLATEPDPVEVSQLDDQLHLLQLCCHPALTPASQVALTLRAVAGRSTAQVAAAFLVPEATMAQRISRAKATLREAGARFEPPPADERDARMSGVRLVLYLVFNEGYAASSGDRLVDTTLTAEAVRLTRDLVRRAPDPETEGLLALMLLTGARTPARTDAGGDLVRLADQDRTRWDRAAITEGVAILERVLPEGRVGRFQLEAAVAAVHAEAPSVAATDWAEIAALYRLLDRVAPSTAVTLGLAVAVAETEGPDAGLRVVAPLLDDRTTARLHRVHAVRAHLLDAAGRRADAAAAYTEAARLCTSIPEQRYLNARAAASGEGSGR